MNRFLKSGLSIIKSKRDSLLAYSDEIDSFIDECGQAISDVMPAENGPIDPKSPRYRALSRLSIHLLPRPSFYHATDERSAVMVRSLIASRDGRILLGQYASHHSYSGTWDIFSARADVMTRPDAVAESLLSERYGLAGRVSTPPFFVNRYDISTANESYVDIIELAYFFEMYAPVDPALNKIVGGWMWLSESDAMRSSSTIAFTNRDTAIPLLRSGFAHLRKVNAIREALGSSHKQVVTGLSDVVVRA